MNPFKKSPETESAPMSDDQFMLLAKIMSDIPAAIAELSEQDQRRFAEAQHSVVKARKAAEAQAAHIRIGSVATS